MAERFDKYILKNGMVVPGERMEAVEAGDDLLCLWVEDLASPFDAERIWEEEKKSPSNILQKL